MKHFLIIASLLFTSLIKAQTPLADELVQIHSVTDTEMNNIANPTAGSYAFNTSVNTMFFFNGTNWVELAARDAYVYVGHFIISSTGPKSIDNLPFKPTSVTFTAHANIETVDPSIDSNNGTSNNDNTIASSFGSMNGYARAETNNTISQSIIYVGGSGTSINNISRYANNTECIGIRYGNQNADKLGVTSASLTAFTNDGFTINVNEHADNLVVLYTAYK